MLSIRKDHWFIPLIFTITLALPALVNAKTDTRQPKIDRFISNMVKQHG